MEETTEAAETTTATINFDSIMVESKPCAAAYRDNGETRGLLCRRVGQVSIGKAILFNDPLQWLHIVLFQRILYIYNVVWRGSVFFDKIEHF